jgi:hypothetical protein
MLPLPLHWLHCPGYCCCQLLLPVCVRVVWWVRCSDTQTSVHVHHTSGRDTRHQPCMGRGSRVYGRERVVADTWVVQPRCGTYDGSGHLQPCGLSLAHGTILFPTAAQPLSPTPSQPQPTSLPQTMFHQVLVSPPIHQPASKCSQNQPPKLTTSPRSTHHTDIEAYQTARMSTTCLHCIGPPPPQTLPTSLPRTKFHQVPESPPIHQRVVACSHPGGVVGSGVSPHAPPHGTDGWGASEPNPPEALPHETWAGKGEKAVGGRLVQCTHWGWPRASIRSLAFCKITVVGVDA